MDDGGATRPTWQHAVATTRRRVVACGWQRETLLATRLTHARPRRRLQPLLALPAVFLLLLASPRALVRSRVVLSQDANPRLPATAAARGAASGTGSADAAAWLSTREGTPAGKPFSSASTAGSVSASESVTAASTRVATRGPWAAAIAESVTRGVREDGEGETGAGGEGEDEGRTARAGRTREAFAGRAAPIVLPLQRQVRRAHSRERKTGGERVEAGDAPRAGEGGEAGTRRRQLRGLPLDLRGSVLELGYYYVTLYLGWPPQRFALIADTGSSITYVPCAACTHCGNHQDPRFNPSLSASYATIPCAHERCLTRACSPTGLCTYHGVYAEASSTRGLLASDLLSFAPPPLSPSAPHPSAAQPRVPAGGVHEAHSPPQPTPPAAAAVPLNASQAPSSLHPAAAGPSGERVLLAGAGEAGVGGGEGSVGEAGVGGGAEGEEGAGEREGVSRAAERAAPDGPRLVFGCELQETGDLYLQRADGIVGLGRDALSLPNQLVLSGAMREDVFSLCFAAPAAPHPAAPRAAAGHDGDDGGVEHGVHGDASHDAKGSSAADGELDEQPGTAQGQGGGEGEGEGGVVDVEGEGGELILGRAEELPGTVWTPLLPSASETSYYIVSVEEMVVGRQRVAVAASVWEEGPYGGVMLDSGTTFSYLPSPAFHAFNALVSMQWAGGRACGSSGGRSDGLPPLLGSLGITPLPSFPAPLFVRAAVPLPQIPGPDARYSDICFANVSQRAPPVSRFISPTRLQLPHLLCNALPALLHLLVPHAPISAGGMNRLFPAATIVFGNGAALRLLPHNYLFKVCLPTPLLLAACSPPRCMLSSSLHALLLAACSPPRCMLSSSLHALLLAACSPPRCMLSSSLHALLLAACSPPRCMLSSSLHALLLAACSPPRCMLSSSLHALLLAACSPPRCMLSSSLHALLLAACSPPRCMLSSSLHALLLAACSPPRCMLSSSLHALLLPQPLSLPRLLPPSPSHPSLHCKHTLPLSYELLSSLSSP
ncbi:unnamed protein product [Closterium sp. Naga37s-1]|nr:unnamed protein product [Closterium sp. Naga37s-1]